eukprot:TRINITY_DN22029_c0_g2_i1.p2 TRINITY_DN22029_c0_g2~~TRINITY_DN22029_c0_g2_i1.p2  ORF type:complete len:110 (+),score=8.85 TRINITY_DN22029_c0_g2_i1:40-330(+)
MNGGGIYFATCPEHTNRKTQHSGPILECQVWLGRVKTIKKTECDTKTTWTKLQKEEFDSVKIGDCWSGAEYVVYNWAQVRSVKLYTPPTGDADVYV